MFSDERAWSNIGKIGVLLGVIAGLLGLYDWFMPDRPVVQARCTATIIDPAFSRRHELNKLTETSSLREMLGEGVAEITAEQIDQLSKSAKKIVDSSFDSIVEKRVTYIECHASNYGGKTAKDVEMVLDQGIYVGFVNNDWIDLLDEKRISLGSIKPKDSVRAVMLSAYPVGRYSQNEFAVRFDDGAGDVFFAEPSYGLPSYFGSEIQTTSGKVFLSMLFFLIATLAISASSIVRQLLKFKLSRDMSRHASKLEELINRADSAVALIEEKKIDEKSS